MKTIGRQQIEAVDNGKEKLRLLPFENETPCEVVTLIDGLEAAVIAERAQGEIPEPEDALLVQVHG